MRVPGKQRGRVAAAVAKTLNKHLLLVAVMAVAATKWGKFEVAIIYMATSANLSPSRRPATCSAWLVLTVPEPV